MKKSILFVSGLLACSAMLVTTFTAKGNVKAFAVGEEFDVDTFKPLSHINGEKVDFLPTDLSSWYSYDEYDATKLDGLYQINSELSSFSSYFLSASDYEPGHEATKEAKKAAIKAIYDKYDDFHQTNNTLSWTSSVEDLKEYRVIVSLDDTLTKVVYDGEHIDKNAPSYTMKNLLTNTHYYWQIRAIQNDNDVIYSPIYDFVTCSPIRTVDIDGVSNTRDFGGETTSFGTIRQGLVYRGARLDEISDEGRDTFTNDFKIKTDLDLRYDTEDEVPTVGRNPLHVDNYVGPVNSLMYGTLDFSISGDQGRAIVKRIFETYSVASNYPIYMHCTVGRDRTGTMSLVLDSLLGLSADRVMRNYWASVFAVTGAFDKPLVNAVIVQAENLLSILGKYGKPSLAENAAALLLDAGLTAAQIDNIRGIMTGGIPSVDPISTHEEAVNYKGSVMVSFKCVGKEDVKYTATKGSVISAPYELPAGYAWFNDDEEFLLSDPVNESVTLIAKPVQKLTVTVHYVDGSHADETLICKAGDKVDLSKYEVEGKTLMVINDVGKEISVLKVSRDTIINILYF